MGCNASSPKGIQTESTKGTTPAKVNLEGEKSALNSDTGDGASTVGMELRGDMFKADDGRTHESELSVAANDIVARVAEEVEDDRHLVKKVDIPRISSGGDASSLGTAAVKIADIASTEELSRSSDSFDGKQRSLASTVFGKLEETEAQKVASTQAKAARLLSQRKDKMEHPDYVFKLLLVCDKRAGLSSLLQWFVESDANFEQQHTKGSKAGIAAGLSGERRSPTKVKGRMSQKSVRQKASPQQKNANSSSSDGVEFKFRTIKVEDKFVRLQLWDVGRNKRFHGLPGRYYKGADGIIIAYDPSDFDSFNTMKHRVHEIDLHAKDVSKLLVASKSDAKGIVPLKNAMEFAESEGLKLLEISPAKGETNFEKVFKNIALHIKMRREGRIQGESEPEPIEPTEWDTIIGQVIKGNEFNLTELSHEQAEQFLSVPIPVLQKRCQHCFPPLKRLVLAGNENITVPLKDWATLTQKLELEDMDLGMCSGVTGDISSVADLEHLKVLILGQTNVSGDISSLAKLTKMKVLEIPTTNIFGDVSVLKSMKDLTILSFAETCVSGDIHAVAELEHLTELILAHTDISGDIWSVSGLRNLKLLVLSGTNVYGNIASVAGLQYLTDLILFHTKISGNIKNVTDLTNLRSLTLQETGISGNISSIQRLSHLENIYLHHTLIQAPRDCPRDKDGYLSFMDKEACTILIDWLKINAVKAKAVEDYRLKTEVEVADAMEKAMSNIKKEARLKAEAVVAAKEEARLWTEAARAKIEEEARLKAEEDAAEAARIELEEKQRRQAEAEAFLAEAARVKAAEEARIKVEAEQAARLHAEQVEKTVAKAAEAAAAEAKRAAEAEADAAEAQRVAATEESATRFAEEQHIAAAEEAEATRTRLEQEQREAAAEEAAAAAQRETEEQLSGASATAAVEKETGERKVAENANAEAESAAEAAAARVEAEPEAKPEAKPEAAMKEKVEAEASEVERVTAEYEEAEQRSRPKLNKSHSAWLHNNIVDLMNK